MYNQFSEEITELLNYRLCRPYNIVAKGATCEEVEASKKVAVNNFVNYIINAAEIISTIQEKDTDYSLSSFAMQLACASYASAMQIQKDNDAEKIDEDSIADYKSAIDTIYQYITSIKTVLDNSLE